MDLRNHYSVGPARQRHLDLKHLSQNKITIKKTSEKRISNKVDRTQPDAHERDKNNAKDNYALSIKPKLNKRPLSDANTISVPRLSE